MEKIVGYLVYAGWVEPFGRPFISALSSAMVRKRTYQYVEFTKYMRLAIKIWILILKVNSGLKFNFLLSRLPRSKDEWFVDAATSWGIGGCFGQRYFRVKLEQLQDFYNLYDFRSSATILSISKVKLPVAYLELLAALVGISIFAKYSPGCLVRLNSDNKNVVSWIR